jgi:hypothetical protein
LVYNILPVHVAKDFVGGKRDDMVMEWCYSCLVLSLFVMLALVLKRLFCSRTLNRFIIMLACLICLVSEGVKSLDETIGIARSICNPEVGPLSATLSQLISA